MGNNLFKAGISKAIAKAMGAPGVLLAATLYHMVQGARTAGALSAGMNATEVSCAARGFIDEYKVGEINGTTVIVGDMKVILIGDTITPAVVPAPGDRILIEGKTRTIVKDGVKRDPDAATYTCQVRG